MPQANTLDPPLIERPTIRRPEAGRFERRLLAEPPPGVFKLVKDGFNSGTSVAWAFRALRREGFEVDLDFIPFADDDIFKELTDGLDPSLWSGFDNATSMTHALVIRDQLRSVQESRQRLAEAGFKGLAITFVTMALDPGFIAAELLTFGVAGSAVFAARATKAAQFIRAGALTGVSQVAVQAYITNQDPEGENMDILYAAAGGFVLGGGGGVLVGAAARRFQKEIEFKTIARAVGAASPNDPAFQNPGRIREFMNRVLTKEGKREFSELLDPAEQRKLADKFIDSLDVDDATKAELRQIEPSELVEALHDRGTGDIDAIYDFLTTPDTPAKATAVPKQPDPLLTPDQIAEELAPISHLQPIVASAVRVYQREGAERGRVALELELNHSLELLDAGEVSQTAVDQLVSEFDVAIRKRLSPPPSRPAKIAGDLFVNVTDAVAKWTPVRWSIAGRLGRADSSPLMRMSASALVEDALPKADGTSNAANASTFGRRKFYSIMGRYYTQTNKEWQKWAKANNVKWNGRAAKLREFRAEVSKAIRREADSNGDPHVQAAAKIQRDLSLELGTLAERHGVKGFEDFVPNASYLSRLWSAQRAHTMVSRYGQGNVEKLIAKALVQGSDDMPQEVADKVAPGFLRIIRKLDDPGSIHRARLFENGTREALEDVLREEAKELTERQINDILNDLVKPKSVEEGVIPRARRRISMDETTEIKLTDNPDIGTMRIEDLMENDSAAIMEIYTRQITGASAMSEALRAINEASGRVARKAGDDIPEGAPPPAFETFDELIAELRRTGTNETDLKKLRTVGRHIMGQSLSNQDNIASTLRVARLFQQLIRTAGFGIAQLPEFGNIMANGGFRAMVQQMPALASIFKRAATGRLENSLLDELEAIGLGGFGRMMDNVTTRMDETAGVLEFGGGGIERPLRRGAKFANDVSFMAPITTIQQRWFASLAAQRFANIAKGSRKFGKRRMADMDISPAMMDRISTQIRTHSNIAEGTQRLHNLNFDSWADAEAASAMIDGINRWSGRVVQTNDIGNMSRWMTTDIGRTIVQYRSFTMNAWEKQFLHKATMRDWQSFVEASSSTLIAGLAYVGQQNLIAQGRADKEEYLRRRLGEGPLGFDPFTIGKAAVQRAGFSSIVPAVADTLMFSIGVPPVFNARNSELSNTVFGNPTAQLLDPTKGEIVGGIRNIAQAVRGTEPFTQGKAQQAARLLPYSQTHGIRNIVNAFISKAFPER